jgi:hypothetical protein
MSAFVSGRESLREAEDYRAVAARAYVPRAVRADADASSSMLGNEALFPLYSHEPLRTILNLAQIEDASARQKQEQGHASFWTGEGACARNRYERRIR